MSFLNNGADEALDIYVGSGTSSDRAKRVMVGTGTEAIEVWPTGPQTDAQYWLDFDDAELLKNKGMTNRGFDVAGTFPAFDHDHVIFDVTTSLSTTPTTNWINGYTASMWVRDTPVDSGPTVFLHRSSPTDSEHMTYIVLDTDDTTTTVVSGLKFSSLATEFSADYSFPVSSSWTHIVVVWARIFSDTFQCRFHINGVGRGVSDATDYLAGDQFTNESLYIGASLQHLSGWSGRLDDFKLWDRPLSDTEVIELYGQGRSWLP